MTPHWIFTSLVFGTLGWFLSFWYLAKFCEEKYGKDATIQTTGLQPLLVGLLMLLVLLIFFVTTATYVLNHIRFV